MNNFTKSFVYVPFDLKGHPRTSRGCIDVSVIEAGGNAGCCFRHFSVSIPEYTEPTKRGMWG